MFRLQKVCKSLIQPVTAGAAARKLTMGVGLGTAAALTASHCQGQIPMTSNDTVQQIEDARRLGRATLRPAIEPFRTGFLTVTTKAGTTHQIYYEESGNPDGQPVVIVHGGPGGGCSPEYRCFHDPEHYRIVCFDQRGCNRSTPHASLDENTTWHLIEDMELLRTTLNIDTWQVFGGSWGSTLSLAYAETHPSRVQALVLRGIFMLRRHELQFYYQEGASFIFPDAWEHYKAAIPVEEHHDLITAYRKRLVGSDRAECLKAARAWTRWENTTSNLLPPEQVGDKKDSDEYALAFARIENHYFHHGGFFEWDDWLLDNVDKIRHIPTLIVQGRYDVVCPAKSAWDLHRRFPEAEFHLIKDSGHSAMEPGTLDILVRATEKFKEPVKKKDSFL